MVDHENIHLYFFGFQPQPQLLRQRRDQEGLDVFPLIAKPCAWQKVEWLARMNVRPTDNKAVWRDKGAYADEELAKFADEVANALRIR